jgi:hypothetical protein
MYNHTAERERLKRRLSITPKEISKQLRNYRTKISTESAVEARGVGKVTVYSNKGSYAEGEDVLPLCHAFLDRHNVPIDKVE